MKAAIVTIGDEILIGQIIDTNSGYIAKSLEKIGIQVREMLSVGDDKDQILDIFSNLQNKCDIVIITGGLGPTKDDITKKTFCEYFDDQLVVDESVLKHVTHLIEGIYKSPITKLNIDQALVPSKCTVLPNPLGTAPGMWMEKNNTLFVSLPGVPYEMKGILENEVLPNLVKKYKRPYFIHKTILTYGQGESLVAERIEEWENNLPEFIKLAYLPSPGRVRLRLTARGTDKQILEDAIENNVSLLKEIIGDIIVGFEEDETIEMMVSRLLAKEGKTISTAESCTGGKIAQKITSIAGASKYFRGSVVSYATDTKVSLLGVSQETIDRYSVVSKEVVKEMVLGAKKLLKTDYAIATTGNAGPHKGESGEEIGKVFIALSTPEEIFIEEFNFGQPREKVIDKSVNKAFEMLYKEILKNVV